MQTFGILDYAILIGTFAISSLIGMYYAFVEKQKTNEELLVGGRNMQIIPSSLSLLATYMSAILVLGYAGEIYAHGTLISETVVAINIFLPIGAVLFLPVLFNLKLTSVYEYLELRFKSRIVRLIATATFILQVLLYLGVVLYAPALALNAVIEDIPIWASIVSVGGIAGVYTAIGGIKAVIYTDVFQIFMMIAGMLMLIIQGTVNLGGISKVFEIANHNGRIEYLNWTIDPFTRHTSLNIFFGQGVLWLGTYGCHQSTVQRYCSMSSLKRACLSMLITGPLLGFTMALAALSGVVIFSTYAGCDPITLGLIKQADQISPHFVLEHLSATSGLLGLFISCLVSGALSTVSSGLNSLACVTWEDFLKRIRVFQTMSENGQGMVVKITGLVYGLLVIGVAFLAGNLGGVLNASLIVNGSVAGPLLGVFLLGVMVPFSNKYGAIVGVLMGHAITFWISIGGYFLHRTTPSLPFRIDQCSEQMLNSTTLADILSRNSTLSAEQEYEWPQKIFTISYTLYPLVGSTVTIIVGIFISLLSGPSKMTKNTEQFIHPWLVRLLTRNKRKQDSTSIENQNWNSCSSENWSHELSVLKLREANNNEAARRLTRKGSDADSTTSFT